jgi:hypothetical protein
VLSAACLLVIVIIVVIICILIVIAENFCFSVSGCGGLQHGSGEQRSKH